MTFDDKDADNDIHSINDELGDDFAPEEMLHGAIAARAFPDRDKSNPTSMDFSFLDKIAGGKKGIEAVAALLSFLERSGAKYQRSAILEAGTVLGVLVTIEQELARGDLLEIAKEQLRRSLSKHKGEGARRPHVSQTFISLALESHFGLRRSRASRWVKVAHCLLADNVLPRRFPEELVTRGGIERVLSSQKVSSAIEEAPTEEDIDEVHFYTPLVPSMSSADLSISAAPDLVASLTGMGGGAHLIAAVIEVGPDGASLVAYSTDCVMEAHIRLALNTFKCVAGELSEDVRRSFSSSLKPTLPRRVIKGGNK